jgi:hypothetical protein
MQRLRHQASKNLRKCPSLSGRAASTLSFSTLAGSTARAFQTLNLKLDIRRVRQKQSPLSTSEGKTRYSITYNSFFMGFQMSGGKATLLKDWGFICVCSPCTPDVAALRISNMRSRIVSQLLPNIDSRPPSKLMRARHGSATG